MLIKNYGLYWARDEVVWGERGRGNRGGLPGFLGKSPVPVDFREQVGVYVLYDGPDIVTHRLVYIGQAGRGKGDLYTRLKQHTEDHLWNRWTRFSWFGLYPVSQGSLAKTPFAGTMDTVAVLDLLEGLLLTLAEPPLNKQGPRWDGVEEYIQGESDPAEAEEELRQQLDDMTTALSRIERMLGTRSKIK